MGRKKNHVACNCRVSTSSKDQMNSLDNQTEFFEDKLNNTPDYKLYKIYPDKGLTGTKLRRQFFDQMLMDAGLTIKDKIEF